MTDMVTRVAEAIEDNIKAGLPEGIAVDYRYAAVAAIETMRAITPAVLESAVEHHVEDYRQRYHTFFAQWNAAIDAALAAKEKSDG